MMSPRSLVLLLATFVAVVAPSAPGAPSAPSASILHVDGRSPTCSDAGSGRADRPFCSIGAAAARVLPGQTVRVAAGSYPEAVTVLRSGRRGAPIVFAAVRRGSVTLQGRANGFRLRNASWVTISGFRVTATHSYGIAVIDSSHVTLSGNHVSYAGEPQPMMSASGIYLNNVMNSLLSGNTANDNSYAGITLTNGSRHNVVRGNLAYRNARGFERAAPGIRLYASPENIVTGNITHHNEDSGIELYSGSSNTVVSNNVAYANGDHGIDSLRSIGTRIVANTVHRNTTAGINVEGGSTGALVANNISVDNGIASPRSSGNIRVDASSTSGTTMNYNLVFVTPPDALVVWASKKYRSLTILTASSGQEENGIDADPAWRNPELGDYHLTSSSPGVDSADSRVPSHPAADSEGCKRVDLPATPNSGVGLRTYDDRGAYELQPVDAANGGTGAAPTTAFSSSDPGCRDLRTS